MFNRFILSIFIDYFSSFIMSRHEKTCFQYIYLRIRKGAYLPVNNRSLICTLVFALLSFEISLAFNPHPLPVPENGVLGGILLSACPSFRLFANALLCN